MLCSHSVRGGCEGARSATMFDGAASPSQQHVEICGLEATGSSVLCLERRRVLQEEGGKENGRKAVELTCLFLAKFPLVEEGWMRFPSQAGGESVLYFSPCCLDIQVLQEFEWDCELGAA